MKVDFRFNHPCGVSLTPGRVYSPSEIAILGVSYNHRIGPIFINDVPKDAWNNITSSEFSSIMIGIKQVVEHLKTTESYATSKISHLEDAYNAWQNWCQESVD